VRLQFAALLNGGGCCCCFDDEGPGTGRGKAVVVRSDVVDCVGGYCARVDDDVGDERAVEEGLVRLQR